jgi:hypothetical protein
MKTIVVFATAAAVRRNILSEKSTAIELFGLRFGTWTPCAAKERTGRSQLCAWPIQVRYDGAANAHFSNQNEKHRL